MAFRLNLEPVGDVCGKRRYHEEHEAATELRLMKLREESKGRVESAMRLRAYWCHRCGAYHIGHLWI